jgi:hypothetical protein
MLASFSDSHITSEKVLKTWTQEEGMVSEGNLLLKSCTWSDALTDAF